MRERNAIVKQKAILNYINGRQTEPEADELRVLFLQEFEWLDYLLPEVALIAKIKD